VTPAPRGAFLAGPAGPLATVTWAPPRVRARVLFLPPFAEEMNKSRRVVACQARAFAAAGVAITVLDPRGTGDSGGEHEDATWDGWRADAVSAWQWLRAQGGEPCVLFGLRLGALLAADLVAARMVDPAALLLWQPVVSGRTFFTQWLRMAAGDLRDAAAPGGKGARAALAAGRTLEIAGYGIAPGLVAGAEAANAEGAARPAFPIVVREVSIATPPAPLPATQAMVARWQAAGARVDHAAVAGPSYWTAVEIEEAPALIDATTGALLQSVNAGTASDVPASAPGARSFVAT